MLCHWKANESLPFRALPALKYATVSYPFMATLPTSDSPPAMPPNPVNSNNTNEKHRRVLLVAFHDSISVYLHVSIIVTILTFKFRFNGFLWESPNSCYRQKRGVELDLMLVRRLYGEDFFFINRMEKTISIHRCGTKRK